MVYHRSKCMPKQDTIRLQNKRLSCTRDFLRMLQAGRNMHKRAAEWLERGAGAIIAPNARYIAEPVCDREELNVANLNLNEIDHEFLTLDVSGHTLDPTS